MKLMQVDLMDKVAFLTNHEPDIDMPVDQGIRYAVLMLRSQGIDTIESCEGGAGHAFPEPTVRFNGGAWEGYRVFAIAMEHGLPVLHLRHVHDVVDGRLGPPCWEMTFGQSVKNLQA